MGTPKYLEGACPRCVARGKTWSGSNPVCAFVGGVFNGDNWGCATMSALRDAVDEGATYNNDDWAAVAAIPEDDEGGSKFLFLQWYKRRGRTEHAHIFNTYPAPGAPNIQPLTLALAEAFAAAHQKKCAWGAGDREP